MTWCEHCRDHFQDDHYDERGQHMAGTAYGPAGLRIADSLLIAKIRELIADPDAVAGEAFPLHPDLNKYLDWPLELKGVLACSLFTGSHSDADGAERIREDDFFTVRELLIAVAIHAGDPQATATAAGA